MGQTESIDVSSRYILYAGHMARRHIFVRLVIETAVRQRAPRSSINSRIRFEKSTLAACRFHFDLFNGSVSKVGAEINRNRNNLVLRIELDDQFKCLRSGGLKKNG